MQPQSIATVALLVFLLTNLLKTVIEKAFPVTNPAHDAMLRLIPLGMGAVGMVGEYLATAPHVTTDGALNALLAGLLGGGVAVGTHATTKRQAVLLAVDKIISEAIDPPKDE